MVYLILALLLLGLFVGALGRLLIPGPNPMTIPGTILVGISGSLLGGILGSWLFDQPGGLISAIVASAVIVWWIDRSRAARLRQRQIP